MARLGVVFNIKNQHKDIYNTFVLTPFHSFNSFNSQTETMENEYKVPHNAFVLTPFHSFNSFNSQIGTMENQHKGSPQRICLNSISLL